MGNVNLEDYLAKPDKTIAEHTKELIIELERLRQYGYIPDEKVYELAKKACEFHDIGKMNREFQKRVSSVDGKIPFDSQIEIAHNVLSACLINPKEFDQEEDYIKVLFAVLYHHHYSNVSEDLSKKSALIKNLLEGTAFFEIKRPKQKKINDLMEKQNVISIKVKGLLHKCDYSASASYQAEYQNDFLNRSLAGLLSDWKQKDAKTAWNRLQQFCKENTEQNIIGIAQTGMGKTEGGLLWMGDQKGFFVLPLRAAINAIYDRIIKNIVKEKIEERVGILHSDSLDYYLKNTEENQDNLLEYEKRGKTLALPLSISTMDQIFNFVLKYPAYELKLTTLSYSKVVIDEIQMYDPNLLAYLIYGLKLIDQVGGKIAILTATFPPFLRTLLSPMELKEEKFMDDSQRHNVEMRDQKLNAQDLHDYYIENKQSESSNKMLVVCNTIKKAQEIYLELKEEFGLEKELHILHSRFTKVDRLEREKEILEFGKTFDANGEIHKALGIWIATSVVEVSLDIDFDVLFTELKDLSSLFQRLGRCNRKGEKEASKANCFVYTEIDSKSIQNGGKGFIDPQIFELSKKALQEVSGVLSEEKKMLLMEEYFTYENLKDSNYIREYEAVKIKLEGLEIYDQKNEEIDLRNILSEDVIPYPVFEKHREEIRGYERELKQHHDSKVKTKELINKINQYTVSMPLYMIRGYEKAIKNKLANSYDGIHLNDYRTIRIIECIYDEMGARQMNFNDIIWEPNMID